MGQHSELEQKSDAELVQLSLDNQENFLYIVRRYEDKLFRYIRRITKTSEADVEDILQNVFIKVYLSLNGFDRDLKFSSWIYRIAHNTVIDNYRKMKARPQMTELNLDSHHLNELTADFSLLEEVDKKDLIREVGAAINKLDIKSQEVLLLKFIEEKDYKEISDIIMKPIGTVASRLNKAKKELYKELSKNLSYGS